MPLRHLDVRGETTINGHCSFEWGEGDGVRVVALLASHCANCLADLARLAARQGLSIMYVEAMEVQEDAEPAGNAFAADPFEDTEVDLPRIRQAGEPPSTPLQRRLRTA